MNRKRLEFATVGFLDEMRKQFVRMRPGIDPPIKPLSEYPPAERSALMAAVQRAITYSQPVADKAFEEWQRRREETAEATQ